jgi:capsular polysaccharide biosynthesis protein
MSVTGLADLELGGNPMMMSLLFVLEETPLIPAIEVDPNSVTPGVIGFLATLFVAMGVVVIIVDMTRRVRRVRYRAEIVEKLDREANPPSAGS